MREGERECQRMCVSQRERKTERERDRDTEGGPEWRVKPDAVLRDSVCERDRERERE